MDIRTWAKQAKPGQRYHYTEAQALKAYGLYEEGQVILVTRKKFDDRGNSYFLKLAVKVAPATRAWADRVSQAVEPPHNPWKEAHPEEFA